MENKNGLSKSQPVFVYGKEKSIKYTVMCRNHKSHYNL